MESGKISLYLKVKRSESSRFLHPCYFRSVSKSSLELLTPPNERQRFRYQKIFLPDDSLVEGISSPLTKQVIKGSNGCIITVDSDKDSSESSMFASDGMVFRTMEELSQECKRAENHCVLMLSYFKVTESGIFDLFKQSQVGVEEINGRSYMPDLAMVEFESFKSLKNALQIDKQAQALVFAVSVIKTGKLNSHSKFLFVHLYEPSCDLKNLTNALQSQYSGNAGVNLPFNSSFLTQALQSVYTGSTITEIIGFIDTDTSHIRQNKETLEYMNSLINTGINPRERAMLNEMCELQMRFKEEIDELKVSAWKINSNHEINLNKLTAIIDIEGSVEEYVYAKQGSSKYDIAEKYREALSSLKYVNAHKDRLDCKLIEINSQINEYQKSLNSRTLKGNNEMSMLEEEIKRTRVAIEQVNSLKTEINHDETGTKKLQKLLLKSHMNIEELSVPLHHFPEYFHDMSEQSQKVINDWNSAVHETKTHLNGKLLKEEENLKRKIQRISKDYEKQLENKNSELREITYESNADNYERFDILEPIRTEARNLYAIYQQARAVINSILLGEFNNSIIPVIIPTLELPEIPSSNKYPLTYRESKTNNHYDNSNTARNTMQRSFNGDSKNLQINTSRKLNNKSKDSIDLSLSKRKTDLNTLEKTSNLLLSKRSSNLNLSKRTSILEISDKSKELNELIRRSQVKYEINTYPEEVLECITAQKDIKIVLKKIKMVKEMTHKICMSSYQEFLKKLQQEKEEIVLKYLKLLNSSKSSSIQPDLKSKVTQSYATMQAFRVPIPPKDKVNLATSAGMMTNTTRFLPMISKTTISRTFR